MPGLLKIGCTTPSVEEHVEERNAATGVPAPFVIEAVFPSKAPMEDEARVHQWLRETRLVGREFFETDIREALAAIRSVVGCEATFVSLYGIREHCAEICESLVLRAFACTFGTQTPIPSFKSAQNVRVLLLSSLAMLGAASV
jgi:hypothetical protein